MKQKFHQIPYDQIPEGIELSMKNCERFIEESRMLNTNDHLASALTSLIIASEEFSKCVFLLEWYKEQKNIPIEKVKEYFSDHKIRLAKFKEICLKSLPSFEYNNRWAEFSKSMGELDQFGKLNLLYVGWLGHSWHDPLKSSGFFSHHNEENAKDGLMSKYDSLLIELDMAIKKTKQDPDFIKSLSTDRVDNISIHKIQEVVRELYGDKIPAHIELTPDYKKIKIKIKPINSTVNHESNLKLQQKIKQRFKEYFIEIELDKK